MEIEYPSPEMNAVMEQVRLAAHADSTVLIIGESGSGKDFLARYIHKLSNRSQKPYRSINCGAIQESLAESELFGHAKGAFTGAIGKKRGLIEQAAGGTLLLNEVGEMLPHLQVKLLTFLDTKTFDPVGGETPVEVNVRIMAATNRDLFAEVDRGRFRQDLFYRLNVLSIEVPPIRARKVDLPVLAARILEELRKEKNLPAVPKMDSEFLALASRYDWPGNVRELRNVLERCVLYMNSHVITADVFRKALQMGRNRKASSYGKSAAIIWQLLQEHGQKVTNPSLEEIRQIKEGCIDCGMTQQQTAVALGVTQPTLSRWLGQLKAAEHPDER